MKLTRVWLLMVAGSVLLTVGVADGATLRATSGNVIATLTYRDTPRGDFGLRLTIARGGLVMYSAPVTSSYCAGFGCSPAGGVPGAPPLQVLDLNGAADPTVILTLTDNGMNACCLADQVFSFDPAAGAYAMSEHNFTASGAGVNVTDLDGNGHFEFVSSDPAFFGEFTDLAGSAEPVQIWTLMHLQFTPVTCDFRQQIVKDAAQWLRSARLSRSDNAGDFAAWAADESRLFGWARARADLIRLLRYEPVTSDLPTARSTYVSKLHLFLGARGYLRSCQPGTG